VRVIGLISGTSYDAIEAAAAELELVGDELRLRPLGALSRPYPAAVRRLLAAALPPAATSAVEVCELDTRIGRAFAETARAALDELCRGEAELVVSHGQTLYHWVVDGQARGTLQLGQPAWIAEGTGLPVVSDLRSRDVAAGGQGAPLVGLFDALLLRARPGRAAALNLGGIANVTVVPPAAEPIAYDVGPGNALIDAAVRHLTRGAEEFDADGRRAARGCVDQPLLELLLADPYYALPPPKSTGKERFHLPYLLAALGGRRLEAEDVVATVTALTARTVADACRRQGVTELVASGGGTRNPTLMAMLRRELPGVVVRTSDELGLPATAKEAYAFAVLGFLTLHGLAGSLPSCTGARAARVLGSITPGVTPLRLPPPAPLPPRRLRIVTGAISGPGRRAGRRRRS
jgi:anhydro-N-acetylmuramic acid kinase